jgi:two-component system, chemotaxis family, chemotaxis protein CheV
MEQNKIGSGNRLELLMFKLGGNQRFGINVLKMQEVIPCPSLNQIPQSHPTIKGMAHLRDMTLPIVDLSAAIGKRPLPENENNLIIITEFNRRIQGFLVSMVDRIVVIDWSDVQPPPLGTTSNSYLSGVIRLDDELIEILDVERVLVEVLGIDPDLDAVMQTDAGNYLHTGQKVLMVDDSSMARKQISRTLNEINVPHIMACDGKEALDLLNELAAQTDTNITNSIPMVISDIEMPEMDGYTLVKQIRKTPALADLYVLVHTSLNGSINTEQAKKSGADEILEKFVPEELAAAITRGLKKCNNIQDAS